MFQICLLHFLLLEILAEDRIYSNLGMNIIWASTRDNLSLGFSTK